jgi:hypothetical protein
MPVLSIIITVLVLVAIIAYFKQLSKKNRALQASVIRDTSAISVVAIATFIKDIISATVKAGQLAAKTVEAEHAESIKAARQSVDTIIKDNGGTIKQAGLSLGHKASSAVYLTDANIALAKAIKDLEAKGF